MDSSLRPTARTGEAVERFVHPQELDGLQFSRDGRYLVTADRSGGVRLFGVATWALEHQLTLPGRPFNVAFPDDARFVAVYVLGADSGESEGETVVVLDPLSGERLALFEGSDVSTLEVRPDGGRLAIGTQEGIRIIDTADWSQLLEIPFADGGLVHGYSEGGSYLATYANEGESGPECSVWDTATNERVLAVKLDGSLNEVAFSADESLFATAGRGDRVRVFDLATGEEIFAVTHAADATGVVFSPDDRLLATSSHDGVAWLHLFRPDDLVDAVCARLSRDLKPDEWARYLPQEEPHSICPAE